MFIVMPENNLSIKKTQFCCTKYNMIVLGFIDIYDVRCPIMGDNICPLIFDKYFWQRGTVVIRTTSVYFFLFIHIDIRYICHTQ